MKHSEIENIIKNNYKRILIVFKRVTKHFKAKDIHLFRIEVKTLNAFLRMVCIDMVYIPGLNLPKKLHEFYKALGIIRSFQIHKHHIQIILENKFSILPFPYLNILENRILDNMAIAKELDKKKNPFRKGEQELLSILPHKLLPKYIEEYTLGELQKIEMLLVPFFPSDESLHSIRKLLKDLLYNRRYIKSEDSILQPILKCFDKLEIHSITELLGDYQDTRTILGILHADYIDQGTNEKDKIILSDLENALNIEKEKIRHKIHNQFQKCSLFSKLHNLSTLEVKD